MERHPEKGEVSRLPAPLIAGKYRILAEIGRGGMGIVYRAEDTKLRRPIALKFLSENLAADPATPLLTGTSPGSFSTGGAANRRCRRSGARSTSIP